MGAEEKSSIDIHPSPWPPPLIWRGSFSHLNSPGRPGLHRLLPFALRQCVSLEYSEAYLQEWVGFSAWKTLQELEQQWYVPEVKTALLPQHCQRARGLEDVGFPLNAHILEGISLAVPIPEQGGGTSYSVVDKMGSPPVSLPPNS